MPGTLLDLIVDMGNTRTKLALFKGERLIAHSAIASGNVEQLAGFLRDRMPDRIAIGSVASEHLHFHDRLRSMASVLHISGTSASPLSSLVKEQHTLGVDRLANAVAASAMFPGRCAVAIDLGTCITYDFVDERGTHLGGAITPGMNMRAKAMHQYSARLPLVEVADEPSPIGGSTTSALQAGLHHGILGEIKEFIGAVHQTQDVVVVLTGGDAPRMARALKSGIFAHPFLTLEGLRLILHHQLGGGGIPGGAVVQ